MAYTLIFAKGVGLTHPHTEAEFFAYSFAGASIRRLPPAFRHLFNLLGNLRISHARPRDARAKASKRALNG